MKSRKVVLAVVLSLALISAILAGGAIALIALDKTVPGALWSLAGVSVGALSAMLTSTSSTVPVTELNPSASAGPNPGPVVVNMPSFPGKPESNVGG